MEEDAREYNCLYETYSGKKKWSTVGRQQGSITDIEKNVSLKNY